MKAENHHSEKFSADYVENEVFSEQFTQSSIATDIAQHIPTQQFLLEGLSCSACVLKVEKAIKQVQGVHEVRINLAENTAKVVGGDTTQIIQAIQQAGYTAEYLLDQTERNEKIQSAFQHSIQRKFQQAIGALSVGSLIMLSHWIGILPSYQQLGQTDPNLYQIVYLGVASIVTITLYFCGGHFFAGVWKSLKQKTASMDTLVSLGASSSLFLSIAIILFPTAFSNHHLYLDASLMVVGLVNIGKALEEKGKKSASGALAALMDLMPNTATIVEEGITKIIPLNQLQPQMRVVLQAGEKVPVDGVVKQGTVWIDESLITGEAKPIKKEVGSNVIAGTPVTDGSGEVIATSTGETTTLARMVKAIAHAQSSKPKLATLTDKVVAVFVPIVLFIAFITLISWIMAGKDTTEAILAATTVVLISCPCALGLAVPMSVIAGTTQAAKLGILVRDAEGLQRLSQVKTMIFDKTGTLTLGQTEVRAEWRVNDPSLAIVASIEQQVTHPLATAMVKLATQRQLSSYPVEQLNILQGFGVKAIVNQQEWYLGNIELMQQQQIDLTACQPFIQEQVENAASLIFVATKQQLINVYAVSDQEKPDAGVTLSRLKQLGIQTVMLTGDNQQTALAFAKKLQLHNVIAQAKPEDKAKNVEKYRHQGMVAMIGDGLNDAQAFANADVSIAIGTGTRVAIESADLTLLNPMLASLIGGIKLSKAVLNNMKLSLFFAFIYNIVLIPVAAFGLLNPILGAMAMACSSLTVVLNANRLRRFHYKIEQE
ncbi:heavy metal translocating P-type ATPase [Mergibacter septicus]|uniref:heavy metal translocating P-type ATPase n=1 Tax=Mergibacter septicus TaxID=221402 RepID=UPI003B969B1E